MLCASEGRAQSVQRAERWRVRRAERADSASSARTISLNQDGVRHRRRSNAQKTRPPPGGGTSDCNGDRRTTSTGDGQDEEAQVQADLLATPDSSTATIGFRVGGVRDDRDQEGAPEVAQGSNFKTGSRPFRGRGGP